LGPFCLEFLKLLGPEMWRGVTNLVGTHQGADFGQLILCAEIGIRVAASESLLIAVQRMQRRVKCGGVIHSLFSDGDWGKGFKGVRATPRHKINMSANSLREWSAGLNFRCLQNLEG